LLKVSAAAEAKPGIKAKIAKTLGLLSIASGMIAQEERRAAVVWSLCKTS
jgi:hypothetical protein